MAFKEVLPLLRTIILSGLIVLEAVPGWGQVIEPDVTNNAGFNSDMPGISLTNSIGEPAITTLVGARSIITQGFLQPEFFIPCTNLEFKVFPNPFQEVITIETAFCDMALSRITVHDLNGREMVRKDLIGNQVDLRNLPVGLYLVQGFSEGGTALGSFTISRTKSP